MDLVGPLAAAEGARTVLDRSEAALKRLGFLQLRVRHYDDTARLELDLVDLAMVLAQREAAVDAVDAADAVDAVDAVGYRCVTLDLEGFRSGNLNDGRIGSV